MKVARKPVHKYRNVPRCTNTIINAPDKVYFLVPKIRKVMRRDDNSSLLITLHNCFRIFAYTLFRFYENTICLTPFISNLETILQQLVCIVEVNTLICLCIPFSSPQTAALAYEVLSIDKELKGSGVWRQITTDGAIIQVNFQGTEVKRLRVAVNAFLRNVLLVVKTIDQFETS